MNTATLGKAIRLCFPNIKTRRLGVRGNSKYHCESSPPIGIDIGSSFFPPLAPRLITFVFHSFNFFLLPFFSFLLPTTLHPIATRPLGTVQTAASDLPTHKKQSGSKSTSASLTTSINRTLEGKPRRQVREVVQGRSDPIRARAEKAAHMIHILTMTKREGAIRPTVRRRARDSQEPPRSGVHSISISSRSSGALLLEGWMTRPLPPPMSSLPPRARARPHPPLAFSSQLQFAGEVVYRVTRCLLSVRTKVAH